MTGPAGNAAGLSHGRLAAQKYAVSGASEEAALGFPSLFEIALPRFLLTLSAARGYDAAAIDALFALMANLNDTNLYHRGGPAAAAKVKALARGFRWRKLLDAGDYGSIEELAAKERINASYVGQLVRLTLLAPDIVEAILDGRQPTDVTLAALIKPFPTEWDRQRQSLRAGLCIRD